MEQSIGREEDRKARLLILECMKIAIRTGNLQDAKELGISSTKIADRMRNKNYTQEDNCVHNIKHHD